MAADKPISVAEWLEGFMDLDAYLANGGNLLDLPIDALDTVPPAMVRSLVKRMSRERADLIARFRAHRNDQAKREAEASEPPTEPEPDAASDKMRH